MYLTPRSNKWCNYGALPKLNSTQHDNLTTVEINHNKLVMEFKQTHVIMVQGILADPSQDTPYIYFSNNFG